MHHWGDDWFKKNGSDLDRAINHCMRVFRIVRIGSHGKEKYGTFRDHVYFWDGGLHHLLWPGYVRVMNRFICFKLDKILKPAARYSGILWLGHQVQFAAYNYAFQSACRRWPNVTEELIHSVDGYELIRPGIFGSVCGKTIHKKYWRSSDEA